MHSITLGLLRSIIPASAPATKITSEKSVFEYALFNLINFGIKSIDRSYVRAKK